jgi:RNA polymerase primary sigma factor
MTRTENQPIRHKNSLRRPTESTGPAVNSFDVNDPLGNYLHELQNTPILTKDEEVALATRIAEGRIARQKLTAQDARLSPAIIAELRKQSDAGFAARDELVEKNLRLVVSIAKKYQNRGVPFLDLIQEGNIGLTRATKKYDLKRNTRFSTYATFWIRQAVMRGIAGQGRTIRTPSHAGDVTRKIRGVGKRLTQELLREPTDAEIAAEFPEMTAKKVEFYLEKSRPILSLQQPTGEDGDIELGDSIPDPEPSPVAQSTLILLKEQMATVLNGLPPREARILQLRYGLNDGGSGLTLEEVGQKMGITRERVRQIETQALSRLRHSSVRRKLIDYLNKDEDR